ncbi:apomucin-like [Chelonus insularis]|uniref:apomucin-like n=1 Tax=Chelonus insularis TaxID=460826 RepID=UPI0015886695|nr:apomucin-like [Chelonus insularis]
MWLVITFIFCILQITFGRYHEKTRFDRSLESRDISQVLDLQYLEPIRYVDYSTRYIAHKDVNENTCYLEKIRENQWKSFISGKNYPTILYPSSLDMTRAEALKLAGPRIMNFCGDYIIKLLQEIRQIPSNTQDSYFNKIPSDGSNVFRKHVQERVKRENVLENSEQMNQRFRRQTYLSGKFRGQTQSQYLNFGGEGEKEGKAEAEATNQSSRAAVSGRNGIGQAQSMSSGGSGCEDCPGYQTYGINAPGRSTYSTSQYPQPDQLNIQSPGTHTGGVYHPDTTPGKSITYPGQTIFTGGQTSIPGTYPGGTVTSGGQIGTSDVYPGRQIPSGGQQMIPGTSYPGGTIPSGGQITYPSGIIPPGGQTTIPGTYSSGTVPSGGQQMIPGTTGTYPGGVVSPGGQMAMPGTYPGGSIVPGGQTIPGMYPDRTGPTGGQTSIPGTYPGGSIPSGGTIPTGGQTYMPGTYPGGLMPTGGQTSLPGTYPGSTIPTGGQVGMTGTYPGGTVTSRGQTTIPGTYPGGVIPPGGQATIPGAYPGGVVAPGGQTSIPGTYPGGVVSPGGQTTIPGTYPGGVVSPGGQTTIPGTYPGGSLPTGGQTTIPGTYPGGVVSPGGQTTIPGTYPGGSVPTGGQTTIPGTYPGGVVPSGGQTSIPGTYPVGSVATGDQTSMPGIYPGGVVSPGGQTSIPGTYPGGSVSTGGQTSMPGTYPGGTVIPGGQVGMPGTYPGGSMPTSGPQITSGAYPGRIVPSGGQTTTPGTYPGGVIPPGGQQLVPGTYITSYPGYSTSNVPGTYPVLTPGTSVPGHPGAISTDDDADSHAMSSVKQTDSGTHASASADGKFGSGVAQSQVRGVYTGSGSFAAQAGISDSNKGAQTQVAGGKEGAMSSAQGMGGKGKSQAQVELNSDSGATKTEAQSSGWNHGTSSQVQASVKGGMADAQANGEGSTSSQAQIGFQPYMESNEKEKVRSKPFRGGGTASAQSGAYRGQSQSQLEGSFQYGITYTGAAQAGSGSGAAASRKPFNFTNSDSNLFKSFEKFGPSKISENEEGSTFPPELEDPVTEKINPLKSSSSSSRKKIISKISSRVDDKSRESLDFESRNVEYADEDEDDENDEEEYAEEDDLMPPANGELEMKTSGSKHITSMHPGNSRRLDTHVEQISSSKLKEGSILEAGTSLPGFTIPQGFRGKVTSISDRRDQENEKSQKHTVSPIFNHDRVQHSKIPEMRSLNNEHDRIGSHSSEWDNNRYSTKFTGTNGKFKSMTVAPVKTNYYTVTNSVAGKLGDARKKYEHRYYTKSSTCGYFTFSCDIVHGSNGRTKICKPKMPTYPDGTPMKC